jgi:hypothetical protein
MFIRWKENWRRQHETVLAFGLAILKRLRPAPDCHEFKYSKTVIRLACVFYFKDLLLTTYSANEQMNALRYRKRHAFLYW